MSFLPAVFRSGKSRVTSVEDGVSYDPTGSTLPPPMGPSRRGTIVFVDPNDKLAVFRHMVGIHSLKDFVGPPGQTEIQHNVMDFKGRAAPNLGIYHRICHREQEAKRGYKFSALLINGCLGLQIVVAAALTAMGAANSSHVGVTAFGAINTVIAGILTYLKGSGLPNRLRYYENEWKKIREYIEQRERDFSRPDCALDVHDVVRAVEIMYEEVRADIQTNTPDSYISVSDIRARASATNPQVPKLESAASGAKAKLQELEMKFGHRLTGLLEEVAQKEEGRLKEMEKGIEKQVEGETARFGDTGSRMWKTGRDLEKQAEGARSRVSDSGARFLDTGRDLERSVDEKGARVSELGREAESETERFRANLSRIGRAVDDEIRPLSPKREG